MLTKIEIQSTPLIRATGVFKYAQQVWRDGNEVAAVNIVLALADQRITAAAAAKILSGELLATADAEAGTLTLEIPTRYLAGGPAKGVNDVETTQDD